MRTLPDIFFTHADLGAWNSNARKRAWIRDFLFAFGRGEAECVADAVRGLMQSSLPPAAPCRTGSRVTLVLNVLNFIFNF